eukprot:CAMPEP_0195532840 /NCGR_PEP_ID=MMETSP0794_2-20130614/39226_1 /TAXON_ID=515487 /ORGANISM="Stephanopyxis turris, Strain CCMP 815" /LENGTH=55 /DNA_ID=CAMNT_0040665205 /DNA_START=84 /DNA_END=248 /DNA_ORIENTATION=-
MGGAEGVGWVFISSGGLLEVEGKYTSSFKVLGKVLGKGGAEAIGWDGIAGVSGAG